MAVDVIIDPSSGQIYWNDQAGSGTQTIAISGNATNAINVVGYSNFFSAGGGGLGTQILATFTDSPTSTFTPGTNAYDLGSTSLRWNFYGTGGNFTGVISTSSSTASTSSTTGALIVSGGAGIAKTSYFGESVVIQGSTASTTPTTGALVVTGGVGISGRLNVGSRGLTSSFSSVVGIAVSTSFNSVQLAIENKSNDVAGAGLVLINDVGNYGQLFLTSTGSATTAERSELWVNNAYGNNRYYANGGQHFFVGAFNASLMYIAGTGVSVVLSAASTSSTSGALTVSGGAGIAKTSYFGQSVFIEGTTASGSTTTGALTVAGGVGIGGSLNVFGTIDVANNIEVLSQKEVRFFNSANTFYTGLRAGSSSANVTFTLPIADGTANQVLYTNGSAGLAWTTVASVSAITTLNGLTATTQTFATGTSGTDFNISSTTSTHTFNIPYAGAASTGLITTQAQTIAGAKTFSGNTAISASTASTTPTTGALVVTGGVGISGSLNVGSSSAANVFIHNTDYTSSANLYLRTGTGASLKETSIVRNSTELQINSVFGTITDYANVFQFYATNLDDYLLKISSTGATFYTTTASTSTITGALVSAGGVGIAKTSYFGQSVFIQGSTVSTSTTTGALVVSGGVGIAGSIWSGQHVITDTTASTTTATGSLLVFGGLGVSGQINAASLQTTGNAVISGNLTFNGVGVFGNATSDTINSLARYISDILPSADNSYDLGNNALGWRNFKVSGVGTIATLQVTSVTSGLWAGTAITLAYGGTNNNLSGIGNSYRVAIYNDSGTAITNISSAGTANSVLFQTSQSVSPIWAGQSQLVVGGASTAANIQGGALGNVLYQTGANATGFVTNAAGSGASILSQTGNAAPLFLGQSQLIVGAATSSALVNTDASTGTRYLVGTILNTASGSTQLSTGSGITIGNNRLTVNDLYVANTTGSGATNSGALVVVGGVGIGGTLNVGTRNLSYTASNLLAGFAVSVNAFAQIVLQNASTGATASSDFIVNNDVSTDSAFYGAMGMNSSGYTGSGSFNLPSAVYFTSTSGDLVLGSTTANILRFVYNSGTTDSMQITGTAASVLYSTASTSTTTGALTVVGGVGVGGSLWTATTNFSSISGVGHSNSVITSGVWSGTAISAVNGGTGQNTYAIGDILYASSSTALARLAAGTAGSVLASGGAGAAPSWVLASSGGGAGTVASGTANQVAVYAATGASVSGAANFTYNTTSVIITNTTASNNNSSGALLVHGGIGASGQISGAGASFTSTVFLNGIRIGQGGNNITFTDSAGTTIGDFNTSNGWLRSAQTTQSTTTGTGALVSSGGLGVAKAASIGETIYGYSTVASTGWSTGSLILSGGLGVSKTSYINGDLFVTSSTASTSTTTGAMVVTGGVGVGGSLWTATTNFSSISGVGHSNSVITSGVWSGTAISAVNGGTGQVSYTIGDILYASSTTVLSKLSAGTAGSVLTSNGAGAAPSYKSAGSGSPAGSTSFLQYNNAGSFGATSHLAYGGNGNNDFVISSPFSGAIQGQVNIGMGITAFDAVTLGKFAGSASGTIIAVNYATGFAGNFADFQLAGSSKFTIGADGKITVVGVYSLPTTAGTAGSVLTSNGTGNQFYWTAPGSAGGGSGTVTSGTAGSVAYYTGTGTTVGGAPGFTYTTSGTASTMNVFGGGGAIGTTIFTVQAYSSTSVRVGIGTNLPQYELEIVGELSATNKSFVIDHPTKPGKKLRYGSLEGPENGVYVRGELKGSNIIETPDHWIGLVYPDSFTVTLTPIGRFSHLYVEKIEDYKVFIADAYMNPIHCYYTVWAERKDIPKLITEY